MVRYYDNVRWAFRFSYTNQTIAGSDKVSGYKPERGLSFSSKINDFALLAEFNFLNYFTGSKRSKFSPYLFGGLSVFTFNPKAEDGTELCSLLTDVDHDSSIPENGKAGGRLICRRFCIIKFRSRFRYYGLQDLIQLVQERLFPEGIDLQECRLGPA